MSLSKIRKLVIDWCDKPEKFITGEMTMDYDYNPPRGYCTMKPLEEVLTEAGFPQLGHGHYSQVFDMGDGKRVVKIVRSSDAAYTAYASYCKESGTKSPYIPKILFSGLWGKKQVYVLEKLVYDEGKARAAAAVVRALKEMTSGYGDDTEMDREFLISLFRKNLASGLLDILADIRKLGHCFDLHYGNIMFRENGDIVLSDPIS